MNKKGISPLIATVLIIGFTMVAAVLVITWINSLVGDQTNTQACKADALAKCTDLTRFVTYGNVGSVGSNVNGTITNSGENNFTVTTVFLDTDSNVLSGCSAETEKTVGAYETFMTTNCSDSNLAKIKFLPTVTGMYGNTECTEICGVGTLIEV